MTSDVLNSENKPLFCAVKGKIFKEPPELRNNPSHPIGMVAVLVQAFEQDKYQNGIPVPYKALTH